MKRKIAIFLQALLILTLSLCFFSCKKEEKTVQPVVIDLQGVTVAENTTLLDVMEEKKAAGEFTYELVGGMITSINGVENSTLEKFAWMLYTSDAELSNTAWGTYVYEEKTLGSATYGAGDLLVKTGEIYVWVYQNY